MGVVKPPLPFVAGMTSNILITAGCCRPRGDDELITKWFTMFVVSILVFYGVGSGLAIVSMLGNVLVRGRLNLFGFIMPFYPFLSGLTVGLVLARFDVRFAAGVSMSIAVPTVIALLEGTVFHAAFLRFLMHPVPHFQIGFPILIFFPLIIVSSFVGYKLGIKRRRKPRGEEISRRDTVDHHH